MNKNQEAIVGLAYHKGRSRPGRSHVGLQSQSGQPLTGKSWVGRIVQLQALVHNEGCIEETRRLAGCQMAGRDIDGLEEDGT